MSAFSMKNSPDNSTRAQLQSTAQQIQENASKLSNATYMTPLDDPLYLLQNSQCFKHERELSCMSFKEKSKKNKEFQITTQVLYGCHMPPYYSVLNFMLMEKLIAFKQNSSSVPKVLMPYLDIIKHEQELFGQWLSTVWEENLKSRRLDVIMHIENYMKSVCDFSNGYIKSHYSGTYRSKMKIDYNREEDQVTNKIEMTYCQRIKTSDIHHTLKTHQIDITDIKSKISFTEVEYKSPSKYPFVEDEICQALLQEHNSDVSICLSSIKHIMNLEKPNSLWMIPVKINIDTNNRKTINIGSASYAGYFSQQEKNLYYLRKQIKKKFRQATEHNSAEQKVMYNYENWKLKANKINSDEIKSLNIIIRNKPHMKTKQKNSKKRKDSILIPKIEYQPEFGFEKINDDQLIEYWLDTYFRTPNTQFTLVSVQHNMDIMMISLNQMISDESISEDKKQMYLQRLYLTLDKFLQLDEGEYVMLHNPKKQFQVDLYQSCKYGGFNLLNMYFVLQQTEITNSLIWNPIDAEILCPIHKYFKVAPCMFKPNPTFLKVQMISDQVHKYKTVLEVREKNEREREANRKNIKRKKNRIKQQLKRDNDLYDLKRKALKTI